MSDCFRTIRVLVAEDNPVLQRILRMSLEKAGFGLVDVVDDGHKAIAAYRFPRTPYGLVVMDLHMPGCDGFEATRSIRSYEQVYNMAQCPVVGFSSDAGCEGISALCHGVGMQAVVNKQHGVKAMISVLPQVLRSPRQALRRCRAFSLPADLELMTLDSDTGRYLEFSDSKRRFSCAK